MFVLEAKFVFIDVQFRNCIADRGFSHKFEFSFLKGILMVPPGRRLIFIRVARRLRTKKRRLTQTRRSAMKKLIAIVALAVAVISAPAFAHAAVFEDAQHGAGIASQS